MRNRLLLLILGLGAAAIAACTANNNQILLPPPGAVAIQNVYWTLGNGGTPSPQLEVATWPLTNTSVPTATVNSSVSNMLNRATSIAFDSSGRLWVIDAVSLSADQALVFNLPITTSSTPAFVLTLNGSSGVFGITFDAQGNLWAASFDNNRVFEYTGPFNSTTAVSPALTLVVTKPAQPVFDATGNLYVPVYLTTTGSVDVFDKPITNLMAPSATFAATLHSPFGAAFDGSGNLYLGLGNGSSAGGIARFNSNNLSNGATPNTTDSTGFVGNPFSFELAVDAAGNLYDADCGGAARLYVYPNVATSFSSSLAPTTTYTDASIATTGCVGGVAIH